MSRAGGPGPPQYNGGASYMDPSAFLPPPGADFLPPGYSTPTQMLPPGGYGNPADAMMMPQPGYQDFRTQNEMKPVYFAGMEEMLSYFEGVTMAVVNYSPADTSAICNELQMLGAAVREHFTPDCTHLMTPYQQGRDYEEARRAHKTVVSYAWLEDCLTARRVVPTTDKVLYAPIRNERGVPGMQSCVIAVAGYKGPIRDDIRELVEAAGAVFHQSFTKKTTHLICYRAESEIYAKALLFKLEGQQLEIVNHRWIEDCIRQWQRMPEDSEAYRRLGVEVDFEERLEAEKRLRLDVEAQLEEEERARRNLQELLEAEERARLELQAQLVEEERSREALRHRLEGEGANREALAGQFSRSRGDLDALQALMHQSEAARARLEEQLIVADDDKRHLSAALEDARRQVGALQAQFARSRQDLLTQLETRLDSIDSLRAELEAANKAGAATAEKLEEERKKVTERGAKITATETTVRQQQDELAIAARDKASLMKQLEAERKSRLHVLSDFENERKQREHLIKQLEAEQKLRQSLQKAVATKEELRLKAEEEIERLNQDIQEMMDEIDRLKTFEPATKVEGDRIQVKMFLDEEIRFLELAADVSYEELLVSVGRVFVESYLIKFEDEDKHHVTLKGSEDLRIAVQQFQRLGRGYLKLFLDKVADKKRTLFGKKE